MISILSHPPLQLHAFPSSHLCHRPWLSVIASIAFAKRPIAGLLWWQTGTKGSLESASIRTDSDPDRCRNTMCRYWHSYVEKPVRQQVEDIQKDTSRGICAYV